jgi:6-phosphogluconolactonase
MTPALGALHVFDDPASLAAGGAAWLCDRACAASGPFTVALSGGSTPKPLYERLAAEPLASRFPWDRTHWVLGDERFVPGTDPASNFRMISVAMLSHVPAPADHVHAVPTEGVTIEQSASAYEATLKAIYGGSELKPDRPFLDVCFLGLGDDGHTASLLPGEREIEERTRWVVPVEHGRAEKRLTMTLPVLDSSRAVAVLVAGAGKAAILDAILSGGSDLPAARVRPAGELHWFVDRAAAGRWAAP